MEAILLLVAGGVVGWLGRSVLVSSSPPAKPWWWKSLCRRRATSHQRVLDALVAERDRWLEAPQQGSAINRVIVDMEDDYNPLFTTWQGTVERIVGPEVEVIWDAREQLVDTTVGYEQLETPRTRERHSFAEIVESNRRGDGKRGNHARPGWCIETHPEFPETARIDQLRTRVKAWSKRAT